MRKCSERQAQCIFNGLLGVIMKWEILVGLEQHKYDRFHAKDIALRGLGLALVLMILFLGFSKSMVSHSFWHQFDKVVHCSLFGFVTLGLVFIFRHKYFTRWHALVRISLIIFGLSALGVISEFSQIIVPHRTFELNDIMANLMGVFIIGLPALFLNPFRSEADPFIPFDIESMSRRSKSKLTAGKSTEGG